MNRVVDLRSDTVTRPTPEMRRAMYEAEVGDDVYGEDPTVNRLQEMAASLVGKEAALFVPSGTMGNEIALSVHASPGDEIVAESQSHVVRYELGGPARLSGLLVRTLEGRAGVIPPEAVAAAIRVEDDHQPGTAILCLENPHNEAGGTVIPLDVMAAYRSVCSGRGVAIHLDGARIFNAAIALGCTAAEVAAGADSVMFCLSKGLCAPIGSMLCGSREFIAKAHRVRKLLGGGMRQVGVIAAAGIVALERMVERLAEDHEKARVLAEGLAELPGLRVDMATVQTNMVYAEVVDAGRVPNPEAALAAEGVLCLGLSRLRFVTHHDVSMEDVRYAIAACRRVFG